MRKFLYTGIPVTVQRSGKKEALHLKPGDLIDLTDVELNDFISQVGQDKFKPLPVQSKRIHREPVSEFNPKLKFPVEVEDSVKPEPDPEETEPKRRKRVRLRKKEKER